MRPRTVLPRALGRIVPRRLVFRHVVLVAGAMFFCVALYYTINPYLLYGPVGRHSFGGDLDDPDISIDPSWQHRHWHDQSKVATSDEWGQRAEEVKRAFLHAYHGYEQHAAPHDELMPLTNRSVNNFNGWGVTMYDSLDTMILMGLDEEFTRAISRVKNATFYLPSAIPSTDPRDKKPRNVYAPFFETVIRYLGGLLSAYALSRESVLLDRADDLGTMLSPAFNTPSGLPVFGVNTATGLVTASKTGILAEVASCQLEYTYLARETGKKEHLDRSARIMSALENADISQLGMFPKDFDLTSGMPIGETLSVGAASDSGHEYLLKLYLLTAQTDKSALDLYIKTTTRILSTLLYTTPKRGLLYVTDVSHSTTTPIPARKFEHLSCFLPGLLALGVHTLPPAAFQLPPSAFKYSAELTHYDLREMHMLAATGLAESCWLMYADQPSGLGPEEVLMRQGITWVEELKRRRKYGAHTALLGEKEKKPVLTPGIETRDYSVRRQSYMLRPETIESIYIMWKTTGDVRWRERGWAIFQALERETKTSSGYATLSNVEITGGAKKDQMPSYFLAETLKYLYLLFHEEDLVPLDRWVFNTEAHPLPVFSWTSWERSKFGIRDP